MAIGVLHAARLHGLHVPDDISVVGFDDIRFAQYIDPPLTTIRQPMRELGEATVRLLLDILRGNMKEAVSVTLPHALDRALEHRRAADPRGRRRRPRLAIAAPRGLQRVRIRMLRKATGSPWSCSTMWPRLARP